MDTATVTLWRPTGQAELDLVAGSGWKAWPPRLPDQPIFYPVRNRWYATKIARDWNVPAGGVGYVTRFEVEHDFLRRYPVQPAGGRDVLEHWVPAEELEEFNAHIAGAIVEVADYRAPVRDWPAGPLPDAWRRYLQGPSWLRRGWLESGAYLWLYPPAEAPDLEDHPGAAVIGSDGGRELLVLDLRRDPAPVLMVDVTSPGWDSAIPQAADVEELVRRVEAGTFEFRF